MFTYDKDAIKEIVRFTGLGIFLGAITGLFYDGLLFLVHSHLLVTAVFTLLLFVALFPNEKLAKILYWNLAILLQAGGLVMSGIFGALMGLLLWFVTLTIVPSLRYVLKKDNIISVSSSALVAWFLAAVIWDITLVDPGMLEQASWISYVLLFTIIGTVYWGLAKIISSCFKEYNFRHTASLRKS